MQDLLHEVESARLATWQRVLPWAVLLLGLVLTLALVGRDYFTQESRLAHEFKLRSQDVEHRVRQRLLSYLEVLRAGAGLFDASGQVTRRDFRIFVNRMRVQEVFPGIQGVGYAQMIPPAALARHEVRVRAEGYAGYTVRPAGQRETYSSIVYLEPLRGRNLLAFGYDMYSEPVRRRAMELARDSGEVGLSGKVRLMQEGQDGLQSGFLMYLPVYRQDQPQGSIEQRRTALAGWVFAPFRMNTFMAGVLGGDATELGGLMDLRVYDGNNATEENLLYDSAAVQGRAATAEPHYRASHSILLGGHQWTLQLAATPSFAAQAYGRQLLLPLVAGLLITALLTWITWLLVHARWRALDQARQLNQRFIESENRFRHLGDAVPVMLALTSDTARLFWLNRAWKAFAGPAAAATDNLAMRALVHPADLERQSRCMRDSIAARKSYSIEYRMRRHDGEYRWLLETGVPRFTRDGTYQGYVICATDITVQKEQEERLNHKRAELEALFMSAPDGVVLVDERGTILKVNPRFTEMLGYAAEKVVGSPVSVLLPERYRDSHGQHVMSYMGAPRTRTMGAGQELYARRSDGRELPIDISLSPVVIDARPHVIATMRDVSDRLKSKQSLRAALQAAEAASRAKSEFVANMSHEIRTPLNGVLGMAELMQSTELAPVQRQYLDMLKSSADGLLGVINDILDFSKIEAGQLQLEAVPFRLVPLLSQVAKTMGEQARRKGLNLACDIAENVPDALVGDPGRLRQILWNLLGNALKFTSQGEVLVSVRRQALDENRRVRLLLSVKDSGIGIAADQQERIFQDFVQADASTSRLYGGTGLGLAITRRLVEMMHGRIWVDSAAGVGSNFQFTAEFELDAADAPLATADRARLAGKRVLVVDDNATNRRILADTLSAHGMQAVVTCNGEEARAWLQAADPQDCDIALLDASMPGMDGVELAAWMAADPAWSHVPVVLASSGIIDTSGAKRAGVCAHLIKPVCRDELLDALATALDRLQSGPVAGTAARPPASRSLRVLLAEDNDVNRLLVARSLTQRGHEVSEATNGREAVELSAAKAFDLILMDMQMPVMDGLDATRAIRDREQVQGGHTRIVALTANAMAQDRRRCLAAGMDDYLSKPVVLSELLKVVEQVGLPAATGEATQEPTAHTGHVDSLYAIVLEQTQGDRSFALSLLEACQLDLPGRVNDLERAFDTGEAPGLGRAAHALKGMLAVFGADELVSLLRRVEVHEAGSSHDDALALRAAVNEALVLFRRRLTGAIEHFRQTSGVEEGSSGR